MIDRSIRVAGKLPIEASATGAHVENCRGS